MNIKELLSDLVSCCVYYYEKYNYIFYNKNIIISTYIKDMLMMHIYEYYVNISNTEYVYDICIMTEPYEKIFILEEDTISIGDMLAAVDNYIDKAPLSTILTSDINIVSLSKHPIENYIEINYNWIKQIIDLYLY